MVTNNAINTGKPIETTKGGTGVATMTTAYAPVCAGTTATGALQVASTGLSTAGNVLTSNGAAALPSFQAPTSPTGITSMASQFFNASGTYTPTTGMKFCIIEVVGGGGGSDAVASHVGAGGGYAKGLFTAAAIGASQVVTIGAGGGGGPSGNNGGTTSVGALISATGGQGMPATLTPPLGGIGSGGDFQSQGGDGGNVSTSGIGGDSMYGGICKGNGNGHQYGGGASNVGAAAAGAGGMVYIIEFI